MIDPNRPDFSNIPSSPSRKRYGYIQREKPRAPFVTIITPFYNSGAIFHETAQSLQHQSFQQWEWIIINDGSTRPEALSILACYRDQDPRILVYDHHSNMGLSAARNSGFHLSSTPYVVQLDSDDLLEPTAIEKWMWFLESFPEYGFVKGYSVAFEAEEYIWRKGFHHERTFLEENLVDPTCMIRKEIFHDVQGYDAAMREGLEDWEFWLRCANRSHWGGMVPEHLDWYRRRAGQSSRWPAWTKEGEKMFLAKMQDRYPSLWAGHFPNIGYQNHKFHNTLSLDLPCSNLLDKEKPRLLIILSRLIIDKTTDYILKLIEKITEAGWEISLIAVQSGNESALALATQYTPDVFILPNFLEVADYPRFFNYFISSRQIDFILFSACELESHLSTFIRAHHPDVPCIKMIQEDLHWLTGQDPLIPDRNYRCFDLITVVSDSLRQRLISFGVLPTAIEVCQNYINTDEWCPDGKLRTTVREEFGFDEDMPLILYATHLCALGRPVLFMQTIIKLKEHTGNFVVIVAGEGPDLEWLCAFALHEGLYDYVKILGYISEDRLRQLMVAADVFFQPSLLENVEQSMYKAMSCGLAVVGAERGAATHLITSQCGKLIPQDSEEKEAQQYAEALSDLIYNLPHGGDGSHPCRDIAQKHFSINGLKKTAAGFLDKAKHNHSLPMTPNVSLDEGNECAAKIIEYLRLFQHSYKLV